MYQSIPNIYFCDKKLASEEKYSSRNQNIVQSYKNKYHLIYLYLSIYGNKSKYKFYFS